MSNVVFLVLAHERRSLGYLVQALGPDQNILIHFDQKSDESDNFEGVISSKRRWKIYWGGFNMVQATIGLLHEALDRYPKAKRFCLISGDTLPLYSPNKTTEMILNEQSECISLHEVEWLPELHNVPLSRVTNEIQMAWRFQNFRFMDNEFNPMARPQVARKWSLSDQQAGHVFGNVDIVLTEIASQMDKRNRIFEKVFFGSQWWCLTTDAAKYVISEWEKIEVREFFRYSFIPDEHLFQCIIGNSPFSNDVRGSLMAPRKIGFSMEEIRRFRIEGNYLFVRKFDCNLSPDIASALDADQYFS